MSLQHFSWSMSKKSKPELQSEAPRGTPSQAPTASGQQAPPPAPQLQTSQPQITQHQEVPQQFHASRFTFDQLGEQGEALSERINSIASRFETVMTLREEFGGFIETFEELMGAHKQAKTRLAEQAALLSQHMNNSTALRRELTDLEARTAAADADVVALRHELSVFKQQTHASAETINALKIEAAESGSRVTSLDRELLFLTDKCTALQETNEAKDVELTALDRQCSENQKLIVELKTSLANAVGEVARLQAMVDEMQPELQRGKQRQTELEKALQKAETASRASDEKLAQEVSAREALAERREREKYDFNSASRRSISSSRA